METFYKFKGLIFYRYNKQKFKAVDKALPPTTKIRGEQK